MRCCTFQLFSIGHILRFCMRAAVLFASGAVQWSCHGSLKVAQYSHSGNLLHALGIGCPLEMLQYPVNRGWSRLASGTLTCVSHWAAFRRQLLAGCPLTEYQHVEHHHAPLASRPQHLPRWQQHRQQLQHLRAMAQGSAAVDSSNHDYWDALGIASMVDPCDDAIKSFRRTQCLLLLSHHALPGMSPARLQLRTCP